MSGRRFFMRLIVNCVLITLLLTSAWPVYATHFNPDTGAPGLSDEAPETGRDVVDEPVQEIYEPVRDRYREVNEAVSEHRQEPQIPAVYFYDLFDLEGEDHLGGWGVWQTGVSREPVMGAGWHQASFVGSERTGWSFGDASSYSIHNSDVLRSFLVSPRISLDSLPVNGTDRDARGPQQVSIAGGAIQSTTNTPGLTEVDSILLYLEHRYNFAINQDGGRVLLVPDMGDHRPPTFDELSGGTLLTTAGTGSVAAFGGDAFTGPQGSFQQSVFDLTQWAGQDVYIVFETGVGPQGNPVNHFLNANRFDRSLPFYGWQIDNVLLEGPAHPYNVKVDTIIHPSIVRVGGPTCRIEEDGLPCLYAVAPGVDQDPLAMVALNRGQFTSEVQPRLTLTHQDTGSTTVCEAEAITLRPGETRAVPFPCTLESGVLEQGERYRARFETSLPALNPDAYLEDNVWEFDLAVNRNPNVAIREPLSVTPRTGDTHEDRIVSIRFVNDGHGREEVGANLTVEYRHPADLADDDASWTEVPDAVLGDPRIERVLDAGEQATFEWSVRLPTPGAYRFLFEGILQVPDLFGGPVTFQSEGHATTLMSAGAVYSSDFTSDDSWQVVFPDDLRPPCDFGDWDDDPGDRICPEYVWDMPSHCSTECKTLIAFVDTEEEELQAVDPATLVSSLRIDVTQWLDFPCKTLADGEDECRYRRFSQPWRWLDQVGERHSIELWYGSPLVWHTQDSNHPNNFLQPKPQQYYQEPRGANQVLQNFHPVYVRSGSVFNYGDEGEMLENSHPANRLVYYNQWLEETYTVDVVDIMERWQQQTWQTQACWPRAGVIVTLNDACNGIGGAPPVTADIESIPIEALHEELNLRFIGRHSLTGASGTFNNCSEGQVLNNNLGRFEYAEPKERWDCPSWRVARSTVVGITPDGEEIPLLRWTGRPGETIGKWNEGREIEQDLDDLGLHDTPTVATGNPRFVNPSGWYERSVESLAPGYEGPEYRRYNEEDGWQRVNDWGGRSGVWTNAKGNSDLPESWRYENLQSSLLLSPPITIPEDGEAPTLSFDHRFQFLRRDEDTAAWIGSTGTVMVRLMDGPDGKATTPWLPVAVQYDHDAPPGQGMSSSYPDFARVHQYYDNDCSYYGGDHPDGDGCNPMDPGRTPMTEVIPLDRLPVLDYRRVNMDMRGNSGFHTGDEGDPENEPDLQALRLLDLRDGGNIVLTPDGDPEIAEETLCDGPCTVQFGFREQTAVHSLDGSNGYNQNLPVGWYIDRFEILAEAALGHDLGVTGTRITTNYDWESLGLGPGTDVLLEVEVTNQGLFHQPAVESGEIVVNVTLQRVAPDGNPVDTITLPSVHPVDEEGRSLSLPGLLSGAPEESRTATIQIPFTVPEVEGPYKILVEVSLDGEILPGFPLQDERLSDNCGSIRLGDGQLQVPHLEECDFQALSTLSVQAVPRFDVQIDVEPRAGRAGVEFPREVTLIVKNTGNVELGQGELQLARFVQHEDWDDPSLSVWTLDRSPPVGGAEPVENLTRFGPADGWVVLEEGGIYAIGARLMGLDVDAEDVLIVESFDTFYADAFRRPPDRHARDPSRDGVGAEDPDGPWELIGGTGIDGDSRGWHFGDADRQSYPDGNDTVLLLPEVDLSLASRAVFSMLHQYEFEDGYDGARVEASLDGGETWRALLPRMPGGTGQGYPGVVYEGNPFQEGDGDPREPEPAWTGSSDGWTTDEFNLGQLEEMVSESLLYELNAQGLRFIDDSTVELRHLPGEEGSRWDRASFARTWAHPSTASCDAADPLLRVCWYREDLNLGRPVMNPQGDDGHPEEFWWTAHTAQGSQDGLSLEVTLPPAEEGRIPQVSFWVWTDTHVGNDLLRNAGSSTTDGISMFFDFGVGENCSGSGFNRVRQSTHPTMLRSQETTPDGWQRFTMNLACAQGAEPVTVDMRFDYERPPINSAMRWHLGGGAALDNVWLETINVADGTLFEGLAIPPDEHGWSAGENTNWQQRDTMPSPPSPWNIRSIPDRSGSGGTTEVFFFGESFESEVDDENGDPVTVEWFHYPANTWERLVSPVIDLRGVGGTEAHFVFWESYNFPTGRRVAFGQPGWANFGEHLDREREIQVQPIVPTLEGHVPGSWVTLEGADPLPGRKSSSSSATGTAGSGCDEGTVARPPGWCRREFDLSEYIGQQVRLGFNIRTDSVTGGARPTYCEDEGLATPSRLGCYWALDDIQIFADTFAGQPVQLRLRTGTDDNIGDGGWTIDNVQLVGFDYDRNIAIIPDEPLTKQRGNHGDELQFTGKVRNLADGSANLVLVASSQVIAHPNEDEPENVVLDLCPDKEEICPTLDVNILAGGRQRDSQDYELVVQLPEGAADNNVHRVFLELKARDTLGNLIPFVDDNLGDHRRSFDIEAIEDLGLTPPITLLDPPTVEPGEPLTIVAEIENEGTVSASTKITFRIRDTQMGDEVGVSPLLDTGSIAPGEAGQAEWVWTPPAGLSGMYLIETEYQWSYSQQTFQDPTALVLVGDRPIYYEEIFDGLGSLQEGGWGSPECSTVPVRDCWRLRTDVAFSGDQSVHVGPLGDALRQGAMYNALQDVRLVSPDIDLSMLAQLNRVELRDSPFNPYLNFRYQANVGQNDGVIVEAPRPQDPDDDGWRWLASEDYTGTLTSANPVGPSEAFTNIRESRWQAATVPLGPDQGTALTQDNRLVGHQFPLGFRFGSGNQADGQGFTLDAISISSYRSTVFPEQRSITLSPGAEKVFHIHVTNDGPAKDTFTIQVDEDRTNLNVFTATVLTPSLTLGPGEQGLAKVRIASPGFALDRPAAGMILLEIASTGDPNSINTALKTLRFEPTPLPDLAVSLQRPSDAGTTVFQEEATSLHATVRNLARADTGRASSPTHLEIGLCPRQTGDVQKDLESCRLGDTFERLALRDLPGIDPGDDRTLSVSWTVPTDLEGGFHVVAIVDPQRLLRELDRSNNVDAIPLDVIALDRPHLRVVPGSLQVLRGEQAVHHAFEGDLLRITGEIENVGTADAENAMARLVNQFPMLERRIDRLTPGETVSFNTQWRAEAGNWVILLEVLPELGSAQVLGPDQSARWDLAVERGGLEVSLDPDRFLLEPGESAQGFLRVVSARGGETNVTMKVHAPEGVLVEDLPGRLGLVAGGVEEVPVRVSASSFAGDGTRVVRVEAYLDLDQAPVAQTEVAVVVSRSDAVSLVPGFLTTGPGTDRLMVTATNHGVEAARLQLEAVGPEGWDVSVPPVQRLEPGVSRDLVFLVTVPADASPGDHFVEIRQGGVHLVTATVRVEGRAVWDVGVEHVVERNGVKTVWVRVENMGNAAGTPGLQVVGGVGGVIDPPLDVLGPGDVVVYRVVLGEGGGLLLPGEDVPVVLPEPGEEGEVQVTRWEILPAGDVRVGETVRVRVELLNTMSEPLTDYRTALFVNGYVAADIRVPIPADGVAEAELAWRARAGDHALSVSLGEHVDEEIINEALRVQEDTSRAVPMPGVVWLLVAGFVLVLMKKRRVDIP